MENGEFVAISWSRGGLKFLDQSGDIKDSWSSIMRIVSDMVSIAKYGGPGGWNDMDMLEVGNGKLTDAEEVAHFSLWAALKSSLIMGNDFGKATADTLSILGNPAVIAISQDPLGQPATYKRLSHGGQAQLWSGPLSGGDYVVLLLNTGESEASISVAADDIFDGDDTLAKQNWHVYDLWGNRGKVTTYNAIETSYAKGLAANYPALLGAPTPDVVSPNEALTAKVATHGVGMYRLRAQQAGASSPPQPTVTPKSGGGSKCKRSVRKREHYAKSS